MGTAEQSSVLLRISVGGLLRYSNFTMKPTEPYLARAISFVELFEKQGWRLKVYSILHPDKQLNPDLIKATEETAFSFLPQPAVTPRHYGLGFISVHQGKSYDFVTVAYWAYDSELRHQTYMRPSSSSQRLEPVSGDELSYDVWDIRLLAFERDAWLQNVLRSPKPDLEAYLQERLTETV